MGQPITPINDPVFQFFGRQGVHLDGPGRYIGFGQVKTDMSTGYGIRDNAGAIETKGLGGAWSSVLDASSAQTLTNKTLSGDTILSGDIVSDEATAGGDIWIMDAFVSGIEAIYQYGSSDGVHWRQISKTPIASETVRSARDPRRLELNGKHYVAYTTAGFVNGTSFRIIESSDLINWSETTEVDFTTFLPGVNRVWSPQWFVDTDGTVHIVVGLATGGDTGPFTLHEIHATNAALTTWSTPVAITGTGFPSSMIDGRIEKVDGIYYLWFKDEATDYIEVSSSSSVASGYVDYKTGDWAGWGNGVEGINLIKVDENTWRAYFDEYPLLGIYYSESTDDWATWSTPVAIQTPHTVSNPGIVRSRSLNTLRNVTGAFIAGGAQAYDSSGQYFFNDSIEVQDTTTPHVRIRSGAANYEFVQLGINVGSNAFIEVSKVGSASYRNFTWYIGGNEAGGIVASTGNFSFGPNNATTRIDANGTGDIVVLSRSSTNTGAGIVRAQNNSGSTAELGYFGSTHSTFGIIGAGEPYIYSTAGTFNFVNTAAGFDWAASGSALTMQLTSTGLGIGGVTPTTGFDTAGDKIRIRTAKTPASAAAAGDAGDICWDASFIYVCVATNTWKRIAIITW